MNVVLFEHPRSKSQEHFNDVANAPLSACLTTGYVAAALDGDGIQVEIYDAYLAGHSFSAAGQRIAGSGCDCDVLGVHAVYFWEQTDRLFELLAAVKAADADVFIVLYGIFPSSFSRQILAAYTCIDAVIIGEPEQVFVELVNQLQKNAGTVAGSISGLVYRQTGRTLAGPPRPLIDPLDRLAFPVRSTLSLNAVGVSVLGSRGCTGRCSFCCVNSFYGREAAWRGRSPANIVAEVTQVLSLVQERYVYFLDADFFGPAKSVHTRVRHLCDLLGDLKLSFGLECRSTDISEKVVQPLAAAGLKHVFLGIESASKAALKRMRKAAGPDRSAVAVELLRSYGIEPNVGFIMFGPDTSLDDVRINFDFLKMCGLLERLHTSADVLYHRQIILRSMPDFNRFDAEGRLAVRGSLGYEGGYRFADQRVGFLADVMALVCRRVLQERSSCDSDIWWQHGETAAARCVNDELVALFEQTLSRLERNEITANAATMHVLAEQVTVFRAEGVI